MTAAATAEAQPVAAYVEPRRRTTLNGWAVVIVFLPPALLLFTVFVALPTDDPKQRRPDISLARRVLGWHPAVDLREGLARTYDWYRRQGGTS